MFFGDFVRRTRVTGRTSGNLVGTGELAKGSLSKVSHFRKLGPVNQVELFKRFGVMGREAKSAGLRDDSM